MPRRSNQSAQTKSLLAALLDRPSAWRYGYDLSTETGLKSGLLYPLLIRLSDQGYLESKWQEPEKQGRPPRHMHRLTTDGLALARSQRVEAAALTCPEGAPA